MGSKLVARDRNKGRDVRGQIWGNGKEQGREKCGHWKRKMGCMGEKTGAG